MRAQLYERPLTLKIHKRPRDTINEYTHPVLHSLLALATGHLHRGFYGSVHVLAALFTAGRKLTENRQAQIFTGWYRHQEALRCSLDYIAAIRYA
ncbi:MAG TPA: hypothetical protein VES20_16570 [Bryobacteraceae bacterium]|nr:hypothetical protein [Bryobacteraceae bacterium]